MKTLKRIIHVIDLLLFYLKEICLSNLKVAVDILTPQHLMTPALLKIKADELTPRQLLVANNLICMTPGTLCCDYLSESKELIVHTMYSGDIEQQQEAIQNTYFKKIKNVF